MKEATAKSSHLLNLPETAFFISKKELYLLIQSLISYGFLHQADL
ncbi:hypothetical protein [Salibacterium halotolerans]|nr:hypothetical protein [Salibacterium halotolerans]